MRRRVRWGMLMAMTALLTACSSEEPQKVETATGDNAFPTEEFTDFVTQESDSGLVTWRLTAPKADRFSNRKVILLTNPVIEFYNKEGARQTTLVSENGEYSEETRNMVAWGNVVVETVDGDVLETDSLFWNSDRDRILSNSFVKLTRGRDVVTGYGLECDPKLTSVDIKRDVAATIRDEEGDLVKE
jgi:LPS export ABC transporter protein LptC